ncbi:hypothetical protein AO724_04790 [Aeromonas allosaccharophila]|nr:hypothetical protein AO724_04790 [Aeromonas allosaccharophila]
MQRHNRTTLCASHGDNFRIDLIADASGQYPLIYEGVLDKCDGVWVVKPIQMPLEQQLFERGTICRSTVLVNVMSHPRDGSLLLGWLSLMMLSIPL